MFSSTVSETEALSREMDDLCGKNLDGPAPRNDAGSRKRADRTRRHLLYRATKRASSRRCYLVSHVELERRGLMLRRRRWPWHLGDGAISYLDPKQAFR